MYKRYLPYALLYVLGVVSAWGVFTFTHSSTEPAQSASAAKQPVKSNIRSAKSRRPVAAAPRIVKKQPPAEVERPVEKRRVAKKQKKQAPGKSGTASATLLAAVAQGDQRAVKRLLGTKKLNVNAVDKRGRALLMTAVENGHSDVARQLIKAGANVDVRSPPAIRLSSSRHAAAIR